MNENTRGNNGKRKAISAAVAIAMVATMLLSGTLAFYFHAEAVNQFSDGAKQVVAHDDFIEGVNKDVYVENTGDTDVYVRVKLTETLKLDGKTVVNAAAHTPDPTNAGTNTDPTIGAGANDGTEEEGIHRFFKWDMGRKAQNGGDVGHYFLSAKDEKYKASGQYKLAGGVAQDTSSKAWTVGDVMANEIGWARNCEVLTMADYQAKIQKGTISPDQFYGWVIDKDGWAYWSQKVEPDCATGLLLNNVVVDRAALAGRSYNYDIKVDFEAVDDRDLGLWTEPGVNKDYMGQTVTTTKATNEAKELLTRASKIVTAEEIQAKIDDATVTSKGAKKLYSEALSRFNAGFVELARKLVTRGDLAQQAYAVNSSAYDDTVLLALEGEDGNTIGGELASSIDPVLAKYLVKSYGADNQLTKDQAMGVWWIYQDRATAFGIGKIASLAGLTAENFPNLIRLDIANSALTAAAINTLESRTESTGTGSIDRSLREQIEYIYCVGCALGGDLNFLGFDALQVVYADKATGVTNITNLPTTLQVLFCSATGVTVDGSTEFNAAKYPDLRGLALPKNTTAIRNLNQCAKLRELYLGGFNDGTQITETLDLRKLNALKILQLSNCATIPEILLPTGPNVLTGQRFNLCPYLINRGVSLSATNSTVARMDIRHTNAWNSLGFSLRQFAAVKLAIRNEAQAAFTNWAAITKNASETKYECVVGADGSVTVNAYAPNCNGVATPVTDLTTLDQTIKDLIPADITLPAPTTPEEPTPAPEA